MSKSILRETNALRRYVERRMDKGVELEDLAVALIAVSDEYSDLAPADRGRDEIDLHGDQW